LLNFTSTVWFRDDLDNIHIKIRCSRIETCLSTNLSTTNSVWIVLGSNPALVVFGRRLSTWAVTR